MFVKALALVDDDDAARRRLLTRRAIAAHSSVVEPHDAGVRSVFSP